MAGYTHISKRPINDSLAPYKEWSVDRWEARPKIQLLKEAIRHQQVRIAFFMRRCQRLELENARLRAELEAR